jgi:hypothetical protein
MPLNAYKMLLLLICVSIFTRSPFNPEYPLRELQNNTYQLSVADDRGFNFLLRTCITDTNDDNYVHYRVYHMSDYNYNVCNLSLVR